MKPRVYYNEFDRKKAAWLRHLIEEGAIAHGVVDERSIHEVQPDDLDGFVQCHFFAGIGLWSLCARRAGWADGRPLWTGSCPCGPFSGAGKQEGFQDPRHLWPEWFRLVRERRPGVLFGEQSADADYWLDLVSTDLEGVGYAFGPVDLPAAGFRGAHRRQRFGFVADADNAEWWAERAPWNDGQWPKTGRVQSDGDAGNGGPGIGLADAHCQRFQGQRADCNPQGRQGPYIRQAGLFHGARTDWLLGTDSRWRPIESGLSPLVDAYPARVGQLFGYGDGIDVEVFTNLIASYMDALA